MSPRSRFLIGALFKKKPLTQLQSAPVDDDGTSTSPAFIHASTADVSPTSIPLQGSSEMFNSPWAGLHALSEWVEQVHDDGEQVDDHDNGGEYQNGQTTPGPAASEGGGGEKKKSTHVRTMPIRKKRGFGSRNLNGRTHKKRVIDVDPGTTISITPPPKKTNLLSKSSLVRLGSRADKSPSWNSRSPPRMRRLPLCTTRCPS